MPTLRRYKEYVVKGVYTIAVGPGFPIHYSGPHIGVRNDARLFQEDLFLQRRICPWEYGLGDKAYVGEPQILTEWKGSNLSVEQMRFNVTVQHYRGRVKHLIAELVQTRKCLNRQYKMGWLFHASGCHHENCCSYGWLAGAHEGTTV